MIISKLKGGLGNQLFQYAVGCAFAHKFQVELKIDIDCLYNKADITVIPRSYRLSFFNLNSHIATKNDKKIVLGSLFMQKIKRRLWKMGMDFFRWNYFREEIYGYHPEIVKKYRSFYLDGYWQSPLYFDSIREVLLKEITLKPEFITSQYLKIKEEIDANQSVAIHVRRGDYVSNNIVTHEFGVCSKEYYLGSTEYLHKLFGQDIRFFIFSDDIIWCKENLAELSNVSFISGFEDYHDLMLMSSCKHQIISNSTFSWWAAWLNQFNNKIVIAPKVWYIDTKFDTSTLIPEEWIRL